jgi:peroxiredoxin
MQNNSILAALPWLAALLAVSTATFANPVTKIKPPQAAPNFTVRDVKGNSVSLADYRGKKVLLTFYRNVGCPICNLRFHELQSQAAHFQAKGLVVLAVYESSAELMQQYVGDEAFHAIMVPNPDQSLYQLYEVEKSGGKMMKGMFHGAMGKMKKGKQLFKDKIKQDGTATRIGADFLIDESGNVVTAHYGKFLGDHLPLEAINQFLR